MNKVDDILEQLKGQQPVIDDPDILTDRIMDSIESLSQPQSRAHTLHLWHKLSIAASILLIIGIGATLLMTDRSTLRDGRNSGATTCAATYCCRWRIGLA